MLPALAFAALLQAQTANEFAVAWTGVEKEIREYYFGREVRKDEMNKRLAEYKPKALAAKTRDEFSGTINLMLSEFKDSHFYFFTKDDELFYGLDGARNGYDQPKDRVQYPSVGVWFWPEPHGYTVWSIQLMGTAYRAGVRRLDVFETCEGKPFHPIRSLRGKVGQTLRFGIRRAGKRLELKLKVTAGKFWDDFREASASVTLSYEDKKFLYLWPSHMYDKEAIFDYYARRLGQYDGVILDLRDGLGGFFEPHMWPFFLPDADVKWWIPGTPWSGGNKVGLKIPLVVLTNRKTISAREFAAYYLKKHLGAKVIGEPTAGGVLGGYVTETYGWWNMMIPAQMYSIDGIVFERNPFKPDIEVKDEVSLDGTDAIVEAGAKTLYEMLPK